MKKEIVKLKEGNSVIYQDKTLMEKANVVSIDKRMVLQYYLIR